jgi:Major tropism determinant N-terminal domain
MSRKDQIQVRRDTTANWLAVDPVLAQGEIGYDLSTNQIKVGNGTTKWSGLSYVTGGSKVYVQSTAPSNPSSGDIWVWGV